MMSLLLLLPLLLLLLTNELRRSPVVVKRRLVVIWSCDYCRVLWVHKEFQVTPESRGRQETQETLDQGDNPVLKEHLAWMATRGTPERKEQMYNCF